MQSSMQSIPIYYHQYYKLVKILKVTTATNNSVTPWPFNATDKSHKNFLSAVLYVAYSYRKVYFDACLLIWR